MSLPPNLSKIENHWFWGKSGTGKSVTARRDFPDFYTKGCNKWWDGYQDQPAVLIDDFGKCHDVLGYHLKIWADHYPFTAEVKGCAIFIRPKHLIVTSNYHPKEIWPNDPSILEPILRRFKVTEFVTGHFSGNHQRIAQLDRFDDLIPPPARRDLTDELELSMDSINLEE